MQSPVCFSLPSPPPPIRRPWFYMWVLNKIYLTLHTILEVCDWVLPQKAHQQARLPLLLKGQSYKNLKNKPNKVRYRSYVKYFLCLILWYFSPLMLFTVLFLWKPRTVKFRGLGRRGFHWFPYPMEAHLGALLAHPGTMEVHPGATKALSSAVHIMYSQCCGSMKFWYGSGSADPYLWLMDPDPDPVISSVNFKTFFCLLLF
jgi:hypothetical protein